jgi:acetolactate synthase-1/2/3 large subunit
MGYDLPTSIGAAIHSPDSEILCIVGDGSFQMNIQELGMISEYNLNIKIIILDNERLGLVSQFQLMNWEKDTGCGFKKSPDFATISKGYGIPAMVIETESELEKGLTMFSESLGAFLLHIKIDSRHDVLPMLLGGQKTNQMWPYFDTDGVKRN